MNSEQYGRKWSWSNVEYGPEIYLKGLRKPTKIFILGSLQTKTWTLYLPNTKPDRNDWFKNIVVFYCPFPVYFLVYFPKVGLSDLYAVCGSVNPPY
jgi:hypothetical protein